MKINQAAFSVANHISDVVANADPLIACIKSLLSDRDFQHPLRLELSNAAQRLEATINREVS
jgi:hypothetical protein